MADEESLAVVPGSHLWLYVQLPGFSGRLYVRARPVPATGSTPGDTYRVSDLYLDGDDGSISAQLLRDIPLQAIEILMNSTEVRASLAARANDPSSDDPAPDIALSHTLHAPSSRRAQRRKSPRPPVPSQTSRQRPPLSRPPSNRLTDEFLQRVADFYLDAVSRGERPLAAMERVAGIPRNTAARWVSTARDRGYLARDPLLTKQGETP